MPHSLNETAFSPFLSAYSLWRAASSVASQGCEEQGEWLHDMAVTLLDINELPTLNAVEHQIQQIAQDGQDAPAPFEVVGFGYVDVDDEDLEF